MPHLTLLDHINKKIIKLLKNYSGLSRLLNQQRNYTREVAQISIEARTLPELLTRLNSIEVPPTGELATLIETVNATLFSSLSELKWNRFVIVSIVEYELQDRSLLLQSIATLTTDQQKQLLLKTDDSNHNVMVRIVRGYRSSPELLHELLQILNNFDPGFIMRVIPEVLYHALAFNQDYVIRLVNWIRTKLTPGQIGKILLAHINNQSLIVRFLTSNCTYGDRSFSYIPVGLELLDLLAIDEKQRSIIQLFEIWYAWVGLSKSAPDLFLSLFHLIHILEPKDRIDLLVHRKDTSGCNNLMQALLYQCPNAVELFFQEINSGHYTSEHKAHILKKTSNSEGMNALMIAADRCPDLVPLLLKEVLSLEKLEDKIQIMRQINNQGRTALHIITKHHNKAGHHPGLALLQEATETLEREYKLFLSAPEAAAACKNPYSFFQNEPDSLSNVAEHLKGLTGVSCLVTDSALSICIESSQILLVMQYLVALASVEFNINIVSDEQGKSTITYSRTNRQTPAIQPTCSSTPGPECEGRGDEDAFNPIKCNNQPETAQYFDSSTLAPEQETEPGEASLSL